MKTLITIGGTYNPALLCEGVPEGLLTAIAEAKLVQVSGYGDKQTFEPSKSEIEIKFISDPDDPSPILQALQEAKESLSKESSKRYQAEAELKQLKQRFGEL